MNKDLKTISRTAILLSYANSGKMERLDAFVAKSYSQLNRKHSRFLCLEGEIKLNERKSKPGILLKVGDVISVPRAIIYKVKQKSSLGKVSVVFEDEDILVLNKASQIHSVSLRSSVEGSVADWITEYCKSCVNASPNPLESGLVNRLDFYTSGLLLAVKNKSSWNNLNFSQKEGEFSKEYIALCEGQLRRDNFEITHGLKSNTDGSKMLLANRGRKLLEASTRVLQVKEFSQDRTLVSLSGASFVRHQLRAHMSSIRHPLVGDSKYGSKTSLNSREGFFLHSKTLSFFHPKSEKRMRFEQESNELQSF